MSEIVLLHGLVLTAKHGLRRNDADERLNCLKITRASAYSQKMRDLVSGNTIEHVHKIELWDDHN